MTTTRRELLQAALALVAAPAAVMAAKPVFSGRLVWYEGIVVHESPPPLNDIEECVKCAGKPVRTASDMRAEAQRQFNRLYAERVDRIMIENLSAESRSKFIGVKWDPVNYGVLRVSTDGT